MITIISGTDRPESKTRIVANYVFEKLKSLNEEVQILGLEEVPVELYENKNYNPENHSTAMNEMQDQYLIKAEKLIFVSPEYNGSFPGSLKHFLDVFSVREYKPTFSGKKAALIGVAGGRAGNLRGMDHLTGVLMHVGTSVYPNRLPLSSIGNHVENDRLTEVSIQKTIDGQIEGFLNF